MSHTRLLLLALSLPLLVAPLAGAQDQDRPLFKSKYPVINVHRHCSRPDPTAVEAELAVLDLVGVDKVVILDGKWTDGPLLDWVELRKKYPKRIILFANVNFRRSKEPTFFQDIVDELNAQKRLGVQGIKFFKNFGMEHTDSAGKLIAVDDPRMDAYFDRCGELGLPVLIHSADPKEYWSPRTYNSDHYGIPRSKFWEDPKMPAWEELIRQRNHLLEKHPNTTFIGAHMGSLTYDLQQLAETLDKYPNFNVECSARTRILGRLNPQGVRDLITKYQDRVLFGTDSSALNRVNPKDADEVAAWIKKGARFYSRHLEYFETSRFDLVEPYGFQSDWLRIAGCELPPEVLEKFYYKNAQRLIPGVATE